jgi:hypothetical protein
VAVLAGNRICCRHSRYKVQSKNKIDEWLQNGAGSPVLIPICLRFRKFRRIRSHKIGNSAV